MVQYRRGGDGAGTVTALLLHSGRYTSMTYTLFANLEGALDLGLQEPTPLMQMPDLKEGNPAFVEKQPAKFNRS